MHPGFHTQTKYIIILASTLQDRAVTQTIDVQVNYQDTLQDVQQLLKSISYFH
jgi:hypothetical protein